MQRKFLEDLGLEKDVIDKIMAENGVDIQREQKKVKDIELERDNYKGQLETAQETLKGFDGVDVKDLKGQIETLTTTLQTKETEYQTQLSERDFNDALEKAILAGGARNSKAVKALLDVEALKGSKNQDSDIKAAIEACQKDNDYLFGATEPINNPVGPTGGNTPTLDANTISLRAAMGLGEAKQ